MKPNRGAFAASQPYAAGGPRSSSVPSRCSDLPGGATHFGSGWAANSSACSASLRKPLMTISAMPSRARGGGHAVERVRRRRGASACPAGRRAGRGTRRRRRSRQTGPAPAGASSASARALTPASWCRPPASLVAGSRTVTRICVGRERVAVGKRRPSTLRGAVARAPRPSAASRPSARYAPTSRWRGFGAGRRSRRLEQARVGVAHRPRARERAEVGRALLAPALADAPGRPRRGTPRPRAPPPWRPPATAPPAHLAV